MHGIRFGLWLNHMLVAQSKLNQYHFESTRINGNRTDILFIFIHFQKWNKQMWSHICFWYFYINKSNTLDPTWSSMPFFPLKSSLLYQLAPEVDTCFKLLWDRVILDTKVDGSFLDMYQSFGEIGLCLLPLPCSWFWGIICGKDHYLIMAQYNV